MVQIIELIYLKFFLASLDMIIILVTKEIPLDILSSNETDQSPNVFVKLTEFYRYLQNFLSI